MVEDCRHLWPAITCLDGFMITGIGVHDRPEPVFTIHRNACSRSTGFGVHNPPERAQQRHNPAGHKRICRATAQPREYRVEGVAYPGGNGEQATIAVRASTIMRLA